ncbi:MAG: DNA polymerase IV [Anaerolineales bacterium]|nr:DNA polymerase IV [Anaerolineales bacterium]
MPRKILHLDLDAFFCAVEEQRDPGLRGRPFAVGGRPEQRGVVSSCSYAARQFGVRSAMPTARALRLCPSLVVVPARHRAYSEASRQVMERLYQLTPLVEQISIDEAFMDVSDLPDDPEQLARRLQARIRDELDLPCSLGVAANKLAAKIANDVGKKAAQSSGPPYAITVIPPGTEAGFLAPLPAEMLWGVGPKTAARLADLGIRTIGDIAAWPAEDLIHRFGEHGRELALRAQAQDDRPIVTEHEIKSISQETTFARDIGSDKVVRDTLQALASKVSTRLRESNLAGVTIKIKIRWPDFTTLTRQVTLPHPTDQESVLIKTSLDLLEKVRHSGQAVRLIGVGVSGLGPPIRQLSLWDHDEEKSRLLQEAIDSLKEKYGEQVIQKGKQKS